MTSVPTARPAPTAGTDGGVGIDAAQLAWGATGLLAAFNRAGVLALADVHTARRIGRIAGETDETVLLAAALAVQALRGGSVCLELTTASTAVFDTAEQQLATDALPWPEVGAWLAACRRSPLVTLGADADGDRPLRLVASGESPRPEPTGTPGASVPQQDRVDDTDRVWLYLERYWQQEEQVRTEIVRRRSGTQPDADDRALTAGLERLFAPSQDPAVGRLDAAETDRQRMAAAVATLRTVSVIAGGPGTGKTTTVARLLALVRATRPGARIALAAPTGKAAARLQEAVQQATRSLPTQDQERLGPLPALTLHRLLGWLPGGRFKHHAGQHLPYDVIVVDEMSMVPLTMMARLLEAVRPEARLVLVGDPDQLSSVEAGAVLADIVAAEIPADRELHDRLITVRAIVNGAGDPVPAGRRVTSVVELEHTWRFGEAIGRLAGAVKAGRADEALEVLRSGDPRVVFVEGDLGDLRRPEVPMLAEQVRSAGRLVHEAALRGDEHAALRALDQHRLLCAHRQGPYGVSTWSRRAEQWLAEAIPGYGTTGVTSGARPSEWYLGRPLLITTNDYELNLYNGDTGVVLSTEQGIRAVFARGGEPTRVAPVRLQEVQTMHALTVHRAQGSQFGVVSFVVPPADSPLLNRELFYTAVTRAQDQVVVYGTEAAIRRAVERPANRASGLRERLR